jgi:hypothetical protein
MLNRVNRVLVTNTEADNTGTSIATIINGDLLILNKAFSNLTGSPTATSAADNDTIYIAQGIAAGNAVMSLPIQLKNVTSVKRSAYSAPAEEVLHLGYNGTDGDVTSANSTEFTLILLFKDDQRVQPQRQTRQVYSYVSTASATDLEIAAAFARKINADKSVNTSVSAVVISNGTTSASGQTATVTNGSKTVTFGGAVTIATGAYVYIKGATYLVKTGVTAGTSITLDTPYQGVTGTVASGTTYATQNGVLSAVTLAGIQITGKAITYNGIDLYQKVNFDASLYPETGDVITSRITTKMAYGIGYWQQVRDLEYFAQGYLGVSNRTAFPVASVPATRAVSSNTYNLLTIEHTAKHQGDLQGQYEAPQATVLAFYSASAPTKSTKETTLIDILESLFESVGIFVE